MRSIFTVEDIVCLADRKNCPYGTKSKEKLVELVSGNIKRLSDMGCRRVLIACCTASTVHPYLEKEQKDLSFPILKPAAEAVFGKRITVIATERTVLSCALKNEILTVFPDSKVEQIAAQELVMLVERGIRDGNPVILKEKAFLNTVEKIKASSPESLLHGCNQFYN